MVPPTGQPPAPSEQGTPLQQSAFVVHACPYKEHVPPASLPVAAESATLPESSMTLESPGAPPSIVPASPLPASATPPSGAGLQGPHMPEALPCATTQVSPRQQSALIVHLPQVGTQLPPPG